MGWGQLIGGEIGRKTDGYISREIGKNIGGELSWLISREIGW